MIRAAHTALLLFIVMVCTAAIPPWIRVRGPTFDVYSQARHQQLAHVLIETAAKQPPLPGLPADVLSSPRPRIYLTPDAQSFQEVTGGGVPEWGAGVALVDSAIIVLPLGQPRRGSFDQLGRVFRHELAHVGLHNFMGSVRVPRWFDEGYATYAAGELDTEGAWLLRAAFVTRRAPLLDSLSLDFPSQENDARIAYLLSASAVRYLVDFAGERGLGVFLTNWKQSGNFSHALGVTFGLTPARFEAAWRKDVKRRYGWLAVISNSVILWSGAALLIVLLYARRRMRDRTKLEQLMQTDPPDRPAYWDGEEELPEGTPDAKLTDPDRPPGSDRLSEEKSN